AEQGEAEEEELQTMRSATYASIPAVQREAEQGEAEEEELQTMRSATFDAIRER
nr:hypothetical protein [Chloroflexota bacterium]